MPHPAPLYHNTNERNAAIIAAGAAGMTSFDIAREHRISPSAVDIIVLQEKRASVARNRAQAQTRAPESKASTGAVITIRDRGPAFDNDHAEKARRAAQRTSCRQHLRAEMLYHWRNRSLPPGFTERRFFEVCENTGLHLSYKPAAG